MLRTPWLAGTECWAEDPDTRTSAHNLAISLRNLGRYEEARALDEEFEHHPGKRQIRSSGPIWSPASGTKVK